MSNPNLKENKFKRMIAVPLRGLIKATNKRLYIKFQYKYITHHKLHFNNPIRYTEKLQYLRLYVYLKNPLVVKCAGRATVRDYIKEKGYEDSLIPIYGVFDKYEDINFDELPDKFVMKCTHACAFNYLCYDKSQIDHKELKKKFTKWLKTNYGKRTVELHYAKIKPQIIIEKFIFEDEKLPTEYKIHCFNGIAKNMYVVTSRYHDIRYNNYYIDWTPFDGSQFNGWKKTDHELTPPENWKEMVEMAETLSKPFPFVRVDLYSVHGKTYFSEMTFTPAKGTLILDDDNCDFEMGKWLKI